jgi:hypothetical protein
MDGTYLPGERAAGPAKHAPVRANLLLLIPPYPADLRMKDRIKGSPVLLLIATLDFVTEL